MHKQIFYFSWPQCAGAHLPMRPPLAELSFNAVPVLGSDHLIFKRRVGRCFRAWIYFHSRCDPVFLFCILYKTYMYNRIYPVLDIFFRTKFGPGLFSKNLPATPPPLHRPNKMKWLLPLFGQFLHCWCC